MLADIGMLQNKNDVKLLVLYVLRAIDRPVSEEQLGDCIMGTGSANYFDYTEAFDELLRFGQVAESDGLYSLTPLGLETIDLLERQLPLSVRKSATNNAALILFEMKKADETMCEIKKDGSEYIFHCLAHDHGAVQFDISARCYTEFQAELMRAKVKEDPFAVFRSVIDGLAGGRVDE